MDEREEFDVPDISEALEDDDLAPTPTGLWPRLALRRIERAWMLLNEDRCSMASAPATREEGGKRAVAAASCRGDRSGEMEMGELEVGGWNTDG